MSNVANLMKEYFDYDDSATKVSNSDKVFGLLAESNLPVKPDKFVWKVLKEPERFSRRFEFDERRRLIDFVNEILEFEDELKHHANITISHKFVDIEVNTKTIESITNLDQEYVRAVDQIFTDVSHYGYKDDRR